MSEPGVREEVLVVHREDEGLVVEAHRGAEEHPSEVALGHGRGGVHASLDQIVAAVAHAGPELEVRHVVPDAADRLASRALLRRRLRGRRHREHAARARLVDEARGAGDRADATSRRIRMRARGTRDRLHDAATVDEPTVRAARRGPHAAIAVGRRALRTDRRAVALPALELAALRAVEHLGDARESARVEPEALGAGRRADAGVGRVQPRRARRTPGSAPAAPRRRALGIRHRSEGDQRGECDERGERPSPAAFHANPLGTDSGELRTPRGEATRKTAGPGTVPQSSTSVIACSGQRLTASCATSMSSASSTFL